MLILPLELQEHVASFLKPADLASLTRLNTNMYRTFNHILWRDVTSTREPMKVLRLLKESASLDRIVRRLAIDLNVTETWHEARTDEGVMDDKNRCTEIARRALERLGSPECRLASLTWISDLLLSDLTSILNTSGRFQCLKRLCVHPDEIGWKDWNYEFIALPLLEYLDFRQDFQCDSDLPVTNFQDAFGRLPPKTSMLSTFKIHILFLGLQPRVEEAIYAISSAINKLELPHLRETSLFVGDFTVTGADFGTFVDTHPLLRDVSLDFRNFSLRADQLPILDSFVGTPSDCAHILLGQRTVRDLTVWTDNVELRTSTREAEDLWHDDDLLSFLKQNRSVKKLRVLPSKDRGMDIDVNYGDGTPYLDLLYLSRLVKATPQLQSLELYVDFGPIHLLTHVFHRLSELNYIRLHYKDIIRPHNDSDGSFFVATPHFFKRGAEHDPNGPYTPEGVFPPHRYKKAVKSMTQTARKLSEVSLHLRGWIGNFNWDKRDLTKDLGEPDFEVEYTLYVSREGESVHVRCAVEPQRSL